MSQENKDNNFGRNFVVAAGTFVVGAMLIASNAMAGGAPNVDDPGTVVDPTTTPLDPCPAPCPTDKPGESTGSGVTEEPGEYLYVTLTAANFVVHGNGKVTLKDVKIYRGHEDRDFRLDPFDGASNQVYLEKDGFWIAMDATNDSLKEVHTFYHEDFTMSEQYFADLFSNVPKYGNQVTLAFRLDSHNISDQEAITKARNVLSGKSRTVGSLEIDGKMYDMVLPASMARGPVFG